MRPSRPPRPVRLGVEQFDARCQPAAVVGPVPTTAAVTAAPAAVPLLVLPARLVDGPLVAVAAAVADGRTAAVDWGDGTVTPGWVAPAPAGLAAIGTARELAAGANYNVAVVLTAGVTPADVVSLRFDVRTAPNAPLARAEVAGYGPVTDPDGAGGQEAFALARVAADASGPVDPTVPAPPPIGLQPSLPPPTGGGAGDAPFDGLTPAGPIASPPPAPPPPVPPPPPAPPPQEASPDRPAPAPGPTDGPPPAGPAVPPPASGSPFQAGQVLAALSVPARPPAGTRPGGPRPLPAADRPGAPGSDRPLVQLWAAMPAGGERDGRPPVDAARRTGDPAGRPPPGTSSRPAARQYVVARTPEPVLHGVPVAEMDAGELPPTDSAPDPVPIVLASYSADLTPTAKYLPDPTPAEPPVAGRSWSRVGLLVAAVVGAGVRTVVVHQSHRPGGPELVRPPAEPGRRDG